MMNILQAMMSGMADEDRTKLVNDIDQHAQVPVNEDKMAKQIMRQMMKILQAQMNDMPDKDRTELVNAIDQQMNILQDQMSGMADKDRTEMVSATDQHSPVHVTSTSSAIKLNRRAKDADEKAEQIMRQMLKILEGIMS